MKDVDVAGQRVKAFFSQILGCADGRLERLVRTSFWRLQGNFKLTSRRFSSQFHWQVLVLRSRGRVHRVTVNDQA